jgi:hypothetical protein
VYAIVESATKERRRNNNVIQPLFQPKTKTPEWNEVPQIIYEGKVIQEFKQKKGFF